MKPVRALLPLLMITLLCSAAHAFVLDGSQSFVFDAPEPPYPSVVLGRGHVMDSLGEPYPAFVLTCGYSTSADGYYRTDHSMDSLEILDTRPASVSMTKFQRIDNERLVRIINPALQGFASLEKIQGNGVAAVQLQVAEESDGTIHVGGQPRKNTRPVMSAQAIASGVQQAETLCTEKLPPTVKNLGFAPADVQKTEAYKREKRSVLTFF